jgi:hypothetical protein
MRLPLAPLLERFPSMRAAAQGLGVHVRQLYRWRTYGVTADQADDLASSIGAHPSELWPEWWDLEPLRCECGELFSIGEARPRKYCSKRCSDRAHRRRRKVAA